MKSELKYPYLVNVAQIFMILSGRKIKIGNMSNNNYSAQLCQLEDIS